MSDATQSVSTGNAARPREKRVKRLEVGCRVSGSFGEYIANPNPNIKRRVRKRIFGRIVKAVDKSQYEVCWDDGKTFAVFGNSLSKESAFASLPPSFVPERQQENPELPPMGQLALDIEEEEIIDSQQDYEIGEHLPGGAAVVGEGIELSDSEEEEELGEEEAEGEEEQGGAMLPAESNLPAEQEGALDQPASKKKAGKKRRVEEDPQGRMPGQLSAETPPKDYTQRKADALADIKALLGQEVATKHKNVSMKWVVIDSWEGGPPNNNKSPSPVGLKSFKVHEHEKDVVLAKLFLHLTFADWRVIFEKLNDAVAVHNNNNSKKKVRLFTEVEFLTGLGLLIGAAEFGCRGVNLWREGDQSTSGEEEYWDSMVAHPQFDNNMKFYRFKDFRHFLPLVFHSAELKELGDPWWQFEDAILQFNNNRRLRVQSFPWLVVDESMSAWRPRTTATGGLPNISFIVRKPEPLGKSLWLVVVFLSFFFSNSSFFLFLDQVPSLSR